MSLVLAVALLTAPMSTVTGTATWYCSDGRNGSDRSPCPPGLGPDDLFAAIDRKDSPWDKGDRVRVTGPRGSLVVVIRDVCGCDGRRVIDLPIGVFERVAGPWSAGVIPVTVTGVGSVPLPATDTAPNWRVHL